MNVVTLSNREELVPAAAAAVWTAVPVDDVIISSNVATAADKDEDDNNSKLPLLLRKKKSRPSLISKRDWIVLMRLLWTMYLSTILLLSTMTLFLVVSIHYVADPSYFLWCAHAVLGVCVVVIVVELQLKEMLRTHGGGVRSLSPYYMSQKTLYIFASVVGILMGVFLCGDDDTNSLFSQFTAIYYYLNSAVFIVLSLMTSSTLRGGVSSIHDGVPNALFSCASSNQGWVRAILWLHPFLVLGSFGLASLTNQGQIGLNKPFFWMAGWPILFMSHIWRKQVALCVYVRADAAVIIDTTTERLVFDQVKLAYEVPSSIFDINELHPEYFENIFDSDSSRCVIVERQNGLKRFVVCPVETEEFIAAVALAVQMTTTTSHDDEEEAGLFPATTEEYATVRCRRQLD